MIIYTDNTGDGTDMESNVTTSVDYLPLLAEYEISGDLGASGFSNHGERKYQEQYDYYKAGNSKVKYRPAENFPAAWWWERSPSYRAQSTFCRITEEGNAAHFTQSMSGGIAPIFRV